MKFSALIKPPPLCLNQEDAVEYLGSLKLFTDMVESGWIAPSVRRPKMKLFDRAAIDRAWDRVRAGEYPIGKKGV